MEVKYAKTIFSAIKPDIENEKVDDTIINLELIGSTLIFKVESTSFTKLRGITNTFFRQLNISNSILSNIKGSL